MHVSHNIILLIFFQPFTIVATFLSSCTIQKEAGGWVWHLGSRFPSLVVTGRLDDVCVIQIFFSQSKDPNSIIGVILVFSTLLPLLISYPPNPNSTGLSTKQKSFYKFMILPRTSGDLFSCKKMKMTSMTIRSLKYFNLVFFFFFLSLSPY